MVPGVLTISTSPGQQTILNLQYKVFGKTFYSAVFVDMETGPFTKWPHVDPLGWLGARKQTCHKNNFQTFCHPFCHALPEPSGDCSRYMYDRHCSGDCLPARQAWVQPSLCLGLCGIPHFSEPHFLDM